MGLAFRIVGRMAWNGPSAQNHLNIHPQPDCSLMPFWYVSTRVHDERVAYRFESMVALGKRFQGVLR